MISVCMATYNGERYLREQVDSILAQLSAGDELVASDHGSTDGTLALLQGYADPRIRIVHCQRRAVRAAEAVAQNFENALLHARGNYIFLADQDDVWLPNRVRLMMEPLQQGCRLVAADFERIDADGNPLPPGSNAGRSPIGNWLIRVPKYYGCSMAFDRELLRAALPFPARMPLHDGWIGMLGELLGHPQFINRPLLRYRQHGSNASGRSSNGIVRKVGYRLRIYGQLLWRVAEVKIGRHVTTLDGVGQ